MSRGFGIIDRSWSVSSPGSELIKHASSYWRACGFSNSRAMAIPSLALCILFPRRLTDTYICLLTRLCLQRRWWNGCPIKAEFSTLLITVRTFQRPHPNTRSDRETCTGCGGVVYSDRPVHSPSASNRTVASYPVDLGTGCPSPLVGLQDLNKFPVWCSPVASTDTLQRPSYLVLDSDYTPTLGLWVSPSVPPINSIDM